MLAEGQGVGSYELVRRLDAGPLAERWLVRHGRTGARRAMKLVTDEACARQMPAEGGFQVERRHANVARVLEVAVSHDPPFILTEYAEGKTLRALLARQGKLPTDEALNTVRQVLAALQAAHAEGVIHGNLDPASILVTSHGAVKVADFGLGKVRATEWASRLGPGAAGSGGSRPPLPAAWDYLSPEQRRGAASVPSDDLYAVGVLACELLTGRRPAGERVDRLVGQAGLPAPIAQFIAKACDERGYRYESAADMVRDLLSLPGGVPARVTNSVGMELRLIPRGPFLMGSEEGRHWERPVHEVVLSRPFYLGVCPVTQSQYERVMGANPSHSLGPLRPAEMVSWHDAQGFCRRLSGAEGVAYRLPTEAQWEYACRAGSTTAYAFGDSDWNLPQYAWFVGNSGGTFPPSAAPSPPRAAPEPALFLPRETHDVKARKPNDWGLYDMHGNVWEWCLDWYGAYAARPQVDPQGPAEGEWRLVRGGSWRSTPAYCRSATRDYHAPDYASDDVGFRVVRPLT